MCIPIPMFFTTCINDVKVEELYLGGPGVPGDPGGPTSRGPCGAAEERRPCLHQPGSADPGDARPAHTSHAHSLNCSKLCNIILGRDVE